MSEWKSSTSGSSLVFFGEAGNRQIQSTTSIPDHITEAAWETRTPCVGTDCSLQYLSSGDLVDHQGPHQMEEQSKQQIKLHRKQGSYQWC